MQNQQGQARLVLEYSGLRQQQAAETGDDTFEGGLPPRHSGPGWLRQPWKPASGRLWPERQQSDRDDE